MNTYMKLKNVSAFHNVLSVFVIAILVIAPFAPLTQTAQAQIGDSGETNLSLIVRKVVINDNGGTAVAADFSFQVDGGADIDFEDDDAEDNNPLQSDKELAIPDGSYTITENNHPGYTVSYSDGCAPAVADLMGPGFCVITNNDIAVEVDPEPTGVATVIAHKIVCTDESELPNYGEGPNIDIDENTAADWVESHQSCNFASDWDFQWAPTGTGDPGDNVGEAGSPWTTFGPTDGANGVTLELDDEDINQGSYVWIREVADEDYIPFTYDGDDDDDVSAEIYCNTDVLHYDNYERVDDIALDETFYCVAWNVPVEEEEVPPACTLDVVSDTTSVVVETGFDAVETYDEHSAWTASIPGATWIWKTLLVENPTADETYTFEKEFSWNGPVVDAVLDVASDNSYQIWINGTLVGADATEDNFASGTQDNYPDVSALIEQGTNTVKIEVHNWALEGGTSESNPAGALWKLALTGEDENCDDPPPPPTCELDVVSDGTSVVVESGLNAVPTYTHPAWTASIPGATWIWESFFVEDPTNEETLNFEKEFEWHGAVGSAVLDVASDNNYEIWINGTSVGSDFSGGSFSLAGQDNYPDVSSLIQEGTNTVKIEVVNLAGPEDPTSNPAGALWKLSLAGTSEDCDEPETGTLIVNKVVVNDDGGTATTTDFSFQVDGGATTTFEADGQNEINVTAGAHTVTEVEAPGYTTTYENCDQVNVPADGAATCTITNDDLPPACTLDVVSDATSVVVETGLNAVPTYDANSAWTASIPGATWIWKTFFVENPTLDETYNFEKTFSWSGPVTGAVLDVASDNSYQIWINGTLVGADPSEINFTSGTQDNYADVSSFIQQGTNTVKIEVKNWEVEASTAESNPAGALWKLSLTSSEENCDDPPLTPMGSLIIQKVVINDDEGTATTTDFSFQIDGGATTTFEADGENQVNVAAGVHTVTEVEAEGYDTTYENCDQVNVPADGVTTCIITNDDSEDEGGGGNQTGTLIIQKVVINDDGGTATTTDFSFLIDGAATTTFEADGENVITGVAFGLHSVSEVSALGYTTTYENCGEIVVGSVAQTCIITNDDNEEGDGRYTLTVTTSGEGDGVVSGAGIACDSNASTPEEIELNDCSETYPEGTLVDIHVTTDEGSTFEDSWSGACSGNNPVCQFTLTGNSAVNANFSLQQNGGGGGNRSGGGGNNGGGGDDDGSVLGSSTQVLGDQIAQVPAGAPNTGAGGTASTSVSLWTMILAFAGIYGFARFRKEEKKA